MSVIGLMTMAAAVATLGQAVPTPTATPAPLDLQIPEVTGTASDPTCGGRVTLATQAFCIATTQAAMEGVVDQYDAAFREQGWNVAAGEANRIIYVRRREGGGCTAFQLMAFADDSRPRAPAAPGFFAFATIPGDICAAQPTPTPGLPEATPSQ